jgi:2-polyprenyl-6-methoxyphenol hydroxylase-like FAD-dependent oxidoreductase
MNPPDRSQNEMRVSCAIVGGGPSGIMLGFLLARAGVEVVVLEKHKDFLRDFRGDTLHPSTLDVMHELGLLEELLRQPHQKVPKIHAHFGDRDITVADFTHLPSHCQFIALMPQWDFLNFMAAHAKRLPGFDLRMEAEVTDLLREGERVAGVVARTPEGELRVHSSLVVGADGRGSTVRERAKLDVLDLGAPIDVLWFRLPKHDTDPEQSFGFVGVGQFLVLIDRSDYWQCAYVIEKGSFPEKRERGLDEFRAEITRCTDIFQDRVGELNDWSDIRLLTVKVDRLHTWARGGLLCIGDSAHAMSPIGGVGINLAIQDAVAAARILAEKLRDGTLTTNDLLAVQERRELPTKLTQRVQVFLHEHFLQPIFDARQPVAPPWPMRLLEEFPLIRRIPGRMIGIGFRPEHVT